jgi:hypothetical protein
MTASHRVSPRAWHWLLRAAGSPIFTACAQLCDHFGCVYDLVEAAAVSVEALQNLVNLRARRFRHQGLGSLFGCSAGGLQMRKRTAQLSGQRGELPKSQLIGQCVPPDVLPYGFTKAGIRPQFLGEMDNPALQRDDETH